MSRNVSRKPSSRNQSKLSFWMAMRLGTSRISGIFAKVRRWRAPALTTGRLSPRGTRRFLLQAVGGDTAVANYQNTETALTVQDLSFLDCSTTRSERPDRPRAAQVFRVCADTSHGSATSCSVRYLSSTAAPASSSVDLASSAFSLSTPSSTGFGALSTRSLASLRPRLVSARTALITWIF